MAQELLTLARPYAKAAFEVALQTQTIPAWDEWLQFIAVVAKDARVRALCDNPKVAQEKLYHFFIDIRKITKDDTQQKNFLRLLIQRKRLYLLPYIAELFQRQRAQHDEVIHVNVESFVLADAKLKQRFAERLKQKLQRDVRCEWQENKALLGGAIIKAPRLDLVIDGSVRNALAQLADELVT